MSKQSWYPNLLTFQENSCFWPGLSYIKFTLNFNIYEKEIWRLCNPTDINLWWDLYMEIVVVPYL